MHWDERSASEIPWYEREALIRLHVNEISELLPPWETRKVELVAQLLEGIFSTSARPVPVERYVKIRDEAHELALQAAFEAAKQADGSFDWQLAGQRMDESAIWVFEECEARGWTPL